MSNLKKITHRQYRYQLPIPLPAYAALESEQFFLPVPPSLHWRKRGQLSPAAVGIVDDFPLLIKVFTIWLVLGHSETLWYWQRQRLWPEPSWDIRNDEQKQSQSLNPHTRTRGLKHQLGDRRVLAHSTLLFCCLLLHHYKALCVGDRLSLGWLYCTVWL